VVERDLQPSPRSSRCGQMESGDEARLG
jgi:hypothetical protein